MGIGVKGRPKTSDDCRGHHRPEDDHDSFSVIKVIIARSVVISNSRFWESRKIAKRQNRKSMDPSALNLNANLNGFMTSTPNEVIPILCGTFTSVYLYILSFSTLTRKLSIHKRIPAVGPHQYLALSPGRDTLYATGWGWTPGLYAFGIKDDEDHEDDKNGGDGGGKREEEDQPWRLTLDYKGKTPISESTTKAWKLSNLVLSL